MRTTVNQHSSETHKRIVNWFERDVFPHIGRRPINSLRPPDILDMMKKTQARGVRESAHRMLGYISKIFRTAMVAELADRDPTVGVAQSSMRC